MGKHVIRISKKNSNISHFNNYSHTLAYEFISNLIGLDVQTSRVIDSYSTIKWEFDFLLKL